MAGNDPLQAYQKLQAEVQRQLISCPFMLVDLAKSTEFKTRNRQIEWVTRLKKFHELVVSIASPLGPTKLLGDGVLVSANRGGGNVADSVIETARNILTALRQANIDSFPGDHALVARIILNYGPAYFFDDDPQGQVVDKLFRMEKFVPDGSIGVTAEFAGYAQVTQRPTGRFSLKGIPEPPYHELILIPPMPSSRAVAKLETTSNASILWSFPHHHAEPVTLVGGHIPADHFDHVQMGVQVGDMNAKLHALHAVASVAPEGEICIYDSSQLRDGADYRKSIISIGGPCYNSITRQLMEDLPVRFENLDCEDDDTPLLDDRYGQRYEAKKVGKLLVVDWGLFIRRRNPHDSTKRVIIACGIESPAVDGIIRAFSHIENTHFSRLMQKVLALSRNGDEDPVPDFYCIMRFEIEAGRHALVPSLSEQNCILHRLEE
jgi:hypothetical protein